MPGHNKQIISSFALISFSRCHASVLYPVSVWRFLLVVCGVVGGCGILCGTTGQ